MSSFTLEHVSFCRYRTDINSLWTGEHYDARNIVMAVKGESFNGYTVLRIGGENRILDQEHSGVAIDWFVEKVRLGLSFAPGTNYFLCPIPDSECVVNGGRTSKTYQLASALAATIPALKISDGLRFLHPMPKSRTTNMRNEEVLFRAMSAANAAPNGPIILLDDVCTSGAHARAAAREIRRLTPTAQIRSLSVARTMLIPDEQVFGMRVDQI